MSPISFYDILAAQVYTASSPRLESRKEKTGKNIHHLKIHGGGSPLTFPDINLGLPIDSGDVG
jgi:hypothetical protein